MRPCNAPNGSARRLTVKLVGGIVVALLGGLLVGCSGSSDAGVARYAGIYQMETEDVQPLPIGFFTVDNGGSVTMNLDDSNNAFLFGLQAAPTQGTLSDTGFIRIDVNAGPGYSIRFSGQISQTALGKQVLGGEMALIGGGAVNDTWRATCTSNC